MKPAINNKEIKKSISDNLNSLIMHGTLLNRNVYLFGANPYTEYIINCLLNNGIHLEGIFDNSTAKQGKVILNVEILSPFGFMADKDNECVILIASRYYHEMVKQLELYGFRVGINIYQIYKFAEYIEALEERKCFWKNSHLEEEVNILKKGMEYYCELRRLYPIHTMMISPTISIGDNFLWGIYLQTFLEERGIKDFVVLVPSDGARKAIQLFTEQVYCMEKVELAYLIDYIMFMGEGESNAILIHPRHKNSRNLDNVAAALGWSWSQIYAPFVLGLAAEAEKKFPHFAYVENIHQVFQNKKLKQGKTIILAPYANMVEELPEIIWVKLAKELKNRGYTVCTNTVGDQSSIDGTESINFSIAESVAYLEYAGNFVSLRSGLCDVVGHADCRQVVVFRDQEQLLSREVIFNDLHKNDIATSAVYVMYDETDIDKNVTNLLKVIDIYPTV